jgi:hypothetical protein
MEREKYLEPETTLIELYDASEQKIPLNRTSIGLEIRPEDDAVRFINMVFYRVWREMEESNQIDRNNTQPQEVWDALHKWINDEIHYEIERRVEGKDLSQINMEQLYVEVRIAVLQAVVARSVELFTAWDGTTAPSGTYNKEAVKIITDDKRNLRADLRTYISKEENEEDEKTA